MKMLFIFVLLSSCALKISATGNFLPVPFHGNVKWNLLFRIENTDQENPLTKEIMVTKSITTNYEEFRKEVIAASASVTEEAEVNIISCSIVGVVEPTIAAAYHSLINIKQSEHTEAVIFDTYTVDPNSTLSVYRLVYELPGVYYQTDTRNTELIYPINEFEIVILIEY